MARKLKNQPTATTVAVIGRVKFRVDTLVAALLGEGFSVLGAVGLSGLRTILREFPSVRTIVVLCNEDVFSPLESIVFRVSAAKVTNFYALADCLGHEEGETCAAENLGSGLQTIDQLAKFAD